MRRTTRRGLLAGTGAAAGALATAACSPLELIPGRSGGGGSSGLSRAATLDFWGGPNAEQRLDQVKAWQAKYPHIKVNFTTVGAVGAGTEALRSFAGHVAAGTAPHVMDFDRFQAAAYSNWRMFRALDEHVRRDKYDLSAFTPAALGEATGFDKKVYGLPSSVDDRLLFWNKQQFAEAGLDPEKPPATWDELKAAATRLTRRGRGGLERIGFHTAEGQASLHIFAWQNGGGFQSADGKTATLPLPANQQALQWMVGLMADQAGWAEARAFRETWGRQAQHAFFTGRLAMMYEINNWAGEQIARYRPEMGFGVAPPPVKQAGDRPLTWSGGYSYVMSRNVKAPDAAWEFIKWLASEEGWTVAFDGEAARARDAGGVYVPGMTGQPALDRKLADKYKTGLPLVDRVPEVAIDLMQHTRFREPSVAASDLWAGVMRAQDEAISQVKSPQQALEDWNAIVQREFDQAWIFVPK